MTEQDRIDAAARAEPVMTPATNIHCDLCAGKSAEEVAACAWADGADVHVDEPEHFPRESLESQYGVERR